MSRNNSNINEKHEKSSVSDPNSLLQTHFNINWKVNFEQKCLSGSIIINFKILKSLNIINLDLRGQDINSIQNLTDDQNQPNFKVEPANLIQEEYPSQNLIISFQKIIKPENGPIQIKIDYKTSPNASGLQWLDKMTTKDKKQPYLFSQFQAIHARSVVPCQDIPFAKITYEAKVETENEEQICLMSALDEKSDEDNVYKFKQNVPMPSYLIAIVVGNLSSKQIGPRSKVWSEPSMIEACAFEFQDTEKFIKIAEDIVGPYVWTKYDLLILPPTFPYGGMENPCLTFVTPTLLAGDKSLANVVAHEIAHSWTGNLVGCHTWEHFWLNEGHTVFLERKIIEKFDDTDLKNLASIEGLKDLKDTIKAFEKTPLLTAMVPELDKIDPDDAFSTVPYEKGCNLLTLIEQKIGGPKIFEPWLKSYIQKYSYKTCTSQEWKDYLYEYFKSSPEKTQILNEIDWEMWFHQSGMPTQLAHYDDKLEIECKNIVKKCASDGEHNVDEYHKLKPLQKVILFSLFCESDFDENVFIKITDTYKMTEEHNCEIKFKWLMFGLQLNDKKTAFPGAKQMVIDQGRMKFTRPLFKAMNVVDRESTVKIFNDQRPFMHPTTAAMVAKDLGL